MTACPVVSLITNACSSSRTDQGAGKRRDTRRSITGRNCARTSVVASFQPTAHADPCRSPMVRTLNVLPLPASIPLRSRLDFGRCVPWHAHPIGPACPRLHFRSVLQHASGFFPTRPRGARAWASHDGDPCMQLPSARGCYQLAPQRTSTSNPVPMPGTPSPAPAGAPRCGPGA